MERVDALKKQGYMVWIPAGSARLRDFPSFENVSVKNRSHLPAGQPVGFDASEVTVGYNVHRRYYIGIVGT